MSEPAGLNMSLDDIIKKKYQGPDQRHGGGRGGGRGGQGNLGIRVGGVQKPQAPAQAKFVQHNGQQQGGYQHHGGYSQQGGFQQQQGRGSYQQGGRGGFGGQQGQGGQFSQQRGRGFNQQQQQQQGGYQRGSTGQQQQHHNQQAGYTQQPAPPPRLPCRTFLRQETGDVVVQLKDTEVVVVSPQGDITLTTGGFSTVSTLTTINRALGSLGISVRAVGPVEAGNWQVSTGAKLMRFHDGIVLPATGGLSASRGTVVLAAMQNAVDGDGIVTFMSEAAGMGMHGGGGGMGMQMGNPMAAAGASTAAMRASMLARGAAAGMQPSMAAFLASPAMLQAMQAMFAGSGAAASAYGGFGGTAMGGAGGMGAAAGGGGAMPQVQVAYESYEEEEEEAEPMDVDAARRLRAQGRY